MAIVVAGIIIAGAVFFSGKPTTENQSGNSKTNTEKAVLGIENDKTLITVKPVSPNEHILGNPNADLIFIEYSDLECPFCKVFHKTMNQLLNQYAKDGKLAWVYRQFPIQELHAKAQKESEASECVASLGGNAKFWEYIGKIFTITPSNDRLDPDRLPVLASEIGIDKNSFLDCWQNGKMASTVESDYQDGLKAGVHGTPHTVILTKKLISNETKKLLLPLYEKFRTPPNYEIPIFFGDDNKTIGLSGAMPLNILTHSIDLLLK